jgi:uncharacterized membrane protein
MSDMPMDFNDEPPGGEQYVYSDQRPQSGGGGNAARPYFYVVSFSGLLGLIFSSISTKDFINHLDRQVHSIHCSFIPGAGATLGESGCRTIMMSPYSSVMRDSMWGGLPISLLAMAVFAYLLMRGLTFGMAKETSKKESLFVLAATLLPVGMSIIYGTIAINVLGATCKLCVGVYISSGLGFIAAIMAHMKSPQSTERGFPGGPYAKWFFEGVIYVVVLTLFYVMFAPQSDKSLNGCGTLTRKADKDNIYIHMGNKSGKDAYVVLDPLCPACKGFDDRMKASNLYKELNLHGVLFPLDNECNWMVDKALHPGACLVSQAMLCDKDGAEAILDYAFMNQEELRNLAEKDKKAFIRKLEDQFPKVKGCINKSKVKNKLNKSLRWAVDNAIPVLTPQLFINDTRVCDEDTDLGLEYTISQMLSGKGGSSKSNSKKRGQ